MDARVNISPEVIAAVHTLGTTLLNVTLAQVTGYYMKAQKLITPETLAGVGAFSGLVSLPALLFRAVAVLDFSTVPVDIVAALFVGKVLMLILSVTIGKITASSEPGNVELVGGVFALLITNSDDLGLGLPVMTAIFPPAMVNMCFVLATLQTSIINPIIFILLGVGMARRDAPTDGTPPASTGEVVHAVLKSLTRNLIILAVAAGLLYNGLFARFGGATLPFFLDNLAKLLGAAFGPIVLFIGGAANVGSFAELGRLESALMPLLTVLLKSLVLPTIVMCGVSILGGSRDKVDFAFAFSSLPAAGSTLVFASKYTPSKEQSSLLAASLALGKLIGFPLLFLSAAIFKTYEAHDVVGIEAVLAFILHLFSALPMLLLLLSACWHSAWSKPPMQTIYVIVVYLGGFIATTLFAEFLPPAPRHIEALLFAATSFFRWSADGAIAIAAYARYRESKSRQREVARGVQRSSTKQALLAQSPPLASSSSSVYPHVQGLHVQGLHVQGPHARGAHVRSDLEEPLVGGQGLHIKWGASASNGTFVVRLAAAASFGLILTMPFYLGLDYPAAQVPDSQNALAANVHEAHLPLWVPYGAVQAAVYAVAYTLLAAALPIFTGAVMSVKMSVLRTLHDFPSDTTRIERHLSLKLMQAFYIRFECLLYLTVTRLALAAAICAQLTVSDELTGSMGNMLLLYSLLQVHMHTHPHTHMHMVLSSICTWSSPPYAAALLSATERRGLRALRSLRGRRSLRASASAAARLPRRLLSCAMQRRRIGGCTVGASPKQPPRRRSQAAHR